jgi:predicted kinase
MTGHNHTYRHASTCATTGKRGYLDRKAARKNRRATAHRTRERAAEVNVYQCDHCHLFHIGHPRSTPEKGN